MGRGTTTPADRSIRSRLRETVIFPHLTERGALRLSALQHYTARAHFVPWHRVFGTPDFEGQTGIFSPLVYVEMETTDLACQPHEKIAVVGETHLARSVDDTGATRHLLREGQHRLERLDGTRIADVCMVNAFTRYDSDPARRRVTQLPIGGPMSGTPSRITKLPTVETLLPGARQPDFRDADEHVWHYGQTDPNKHVNGIEYLRTMELFVADVLYRRGQDMRRLYAARARVVYRKPCFRGEGYRQMAWFTGEAPLTMCGVFVRADDPPDARPAAAVELTYRLHDED